MNDYKETISLFIRSPMALINGIKLIAVLKSPFYVLNSLGESQIQSEQDTWTFVP